MVATFTRKPGRPWRIIAEEASHEYDADRMIQLIEELNQALQDQGFVDSQPNAEKKTA